ncbi:conjugative transposon protein TraM [Arenibacter sp. 6A1]|uniref:conjugative transposon protein TraM n=1 Tax=Arenibacter sp. 6A1 TaxID=2720391 RepID=UPI0014454855|nr:conjugative transposon protein TraM [Arenibacter sp. 6A1]NKI27443.1 conjugative transposon protein TraM [Arenibacter sp. 6A1]
MRIEKNKIVFSAVLLIILLFIFGYALLIMENGNTDNESLEDTEVPKLEQQQKEYNTKLEAVDNIKEVQLKNAPSIYDEKLLDATGVYDPNFLDKDKQRIVDSIYNQGRINYSENRYRNSVPTKERPIETIASTSQKNEVETPVSAKELALEHQLFFASAPVSDPFSFSPNIRDVYVEVDGNQVVKANSRLQMRLLQEIKLGIETFPRNTLVYGVVSFQPNRTLIKIDNIDHLPVKLRAFDLQDGLEGIYVVNSFRGEVTNEVAGDLLNDINIAGIPQVSGIKKVFQRNNRSVKVAVSNKYKLVLKAN